VRRRLWLIFASGALQGAVGWWMCFGLSQRVEGSQYRLATHLALAMLIFAAVVWTLCPDDGPAAARCLLALKITSVALLTLTFVQLYLGALLAGLRAGRIYNTWPTSMVHSSRRRRDCSSKKPGGAICSTTRSPVQFEHSHWRPMRYLCWPSCMDPDARSLGAGTAVVHGALWLVAAVTFQAMLGISRCFIGPIALGLAHQAVAMSF